jgi:2-O-methyltransferase
LLVLQFPLEIVSAFLPRRPIIVEADAHHGEDTIIFANKWPKATIYAFEPLPSHFCHLERAVAHCSKVCVFPFALSRATADFTFFTGSGSHETSLFEDSFNPNRHGDGRVTIHCKTLDDWARDARVDHVDYLWLDMAGAEIPMLGAAPNILQTVRVISCEVNFLDFRKGLAHLENLTAFLQSKGFSLCKIWSAPIGQTTVLFVR